MRPRRGAQVVEHEQQMAVAEKASQGGRRRLAVSRRDRQRPHHGCSRSRASVTDTSDTKRAPSAKSSASRLAVSTASRVLPTPPGPISVTMRVRTSPIRPQRSSNSVSRANSAVGRTSATLPCRPVPRRGRATRQAAHARQLAPDVECPRGPLLGPLGEHREDQLFEFRRHGSVPTRKADVAPHQVLRKDLRRIGSAERTRPVTSSYSVIPRAYRSLASHAPSPRICSGER